MQASRPATDAVSDELARLRGRRIGTCHGCGESVFTAQSFTRFRGRVAHVRCATPARPAGARAALRVGWTAR